MNPKDKGNRFELKMLRKLREIWPDLHRTIGSGSAKDESADAKSNTCPYLFEFKHHKRLSKKQLHDFFDKVCDEAKEHKKVPVLIYKENNRPIIVVTEDMLWFLKMLFFDDWFEYERIITNNFTDVNEESKSINQEV